MRLSSPANFHKYLSLGEGEEREVRGGRGGEGGGEERGEGRREGRGGGGGGGGEGGGRVDVSLVP